MKIAIPTNDGINICAHFGRCREFLIFEAQNGQVKLIETRVNACCHGHGSGSSNGVAEQHSHSGFVDALRDCETVLCGGIGAGAVAALKGGQGGNFEQIAALHSGTSGGPIRGRHESPDQYRARAGPIG